MAFDNRFSLYKLEVFCSVVDAGGVGRAAKSLFVTQPVVSAHLRSLQEHLGVRLLERDGRGVRLTDAGRAVYEWAREILSGTRRIARELDDLGAGSPDALIITAGPSLASYVLPPIVCRLRLRHPDARIVLDVSEPTQALAAVQSGDADVAVVVSVAPDELADFDAEEIAREQLVLVTHSDHDCGEDAISPEQIRGLSLISSCGDHLTVGDIGDLLASIGYPTPASTAELGHPEAIKLAVREGLGSAFLLRSAVGRDLAAGELHEIPVPGALTVPVYAVWASGRAPTSLQAAFVDALAREAPPVGRVIPLERSSREAHAPQLHAA